MLVFLFFCSLIHSSNRKYIWEKNAKLLERRQSKPIGIKYYKLKDDENEAKITREICPMFPPLVFSSKEPQITKKILETSIYHLRRKYSNLKVRFYVKLAELVIHESYLERLYPLMTNIETKIINIMKLFARIDDYTDKIVLRICYDMICSCNRAITIFAKNIEILASYY
ncbi:hypothetical protein CWI36_1097p0020 [Hamiltosporidium magnivora]|uniref:Uncharacterized protein n=1 Tax=Hamiltosporidium magnivora TaxID=148818 RepID=A0A4Q9L5K5_9MICR|nr:hypothetical protein CWI36_1097p0020 [Hamiltosporidium magnivora]